MDYFEDVEAEGNHQEWGYVDDININVLRVNKRACTSG